MAEIDIHYMEDLKNVNEKRVWDVIAYYLDNNDTSHICCCALCIIDIAAITLNNITPHYQVDENLTVAKLKVPDIEIYRQLKKAVDTVSKRPHH